MSSVSSMYLYSTRWVATEMCRETKASLAFRRALGERQNPTTSTEIHPLLNSWERFLPFTPGMSSPARRIHAGSEWSGRQSRCPSGQGS